MLHEDINKISNICYIKHDVLYIDINHCIFVEYKH